MSIKIMTEVWAKARLGGSRLLILLALADNANDERYCWPSIDTLAKKSRLQRRQVQNVLSELESTGYLVVDRSQEFKRTNVYHIQPVGNWGVQQNAPVQSDAPMHQDAPTHAPECTPPMQPSAPKPSGKPSRKPRSASQSALANDVESKHPAILCYKAVVGRYPPKSQWHKIAQTLGGDPDQPKLRRCFVAWEGEGHKPTNLAWLYEWYVTGIPAKKDRGGAKPHNGLKDQDYVGYARDVGEQEIPF